MFVLIQIQYLSKQAWCEVDTSKQLHILCKNFIIQNEYTDINNLGTVLRNNCPHLPILFFCPSKPGTTHYCGIIERDHRLYITIWPITELKTQCLCHERDCDHFSPSNKGPYTNTGNMFDAAISFQIIHNWICQYQITMHCLEACEEYILTW